MRRDEMRRDESRSAGRTRGAIAETGPLSAPGGETKGEGRRGESRKPDRVAVSRREESGRRDRRQTNWQLGTRRVSALLAAAAAAEAT